MSYSRCSFKAVFDLVLAFAGQSSVDATQKVQIHGFINQRLQRWAWIAWQWPEITPVELRRYRDVYASGTAYAAPSASSASEVFFPPTQQYYQALRATTGNAPATLSNGVYTVNAAYWAVAGGPYSGADWLDASAYVVGTIVRNPADNRYYQCYVAHTSSGALDTAKFGILTVFDPYVSRTQSWETNAVGEFIGMFLDNPLAERNPRRVPYILDGLGAHVPSTTWPHWGWGRGYGGGSYVPGMVYLKFRLPCPDFKASVFDPTAVYTAGVGKVYFEGTTADLEGDYWLCKTTTSAGESPESAAAKWTRLEFPAWLQAAVARRALADWLRYGAQRESARAEDSEADDALFQAQLQAGSQQGQVLRWRKSA